MDLKSILNADPDPEVASGSTDTSRFISSSGIEGTGPEAEQTGSNDFAPPATSSEVSNEQIVSSRRLVPFPGGQDGWEQAWQVWQNLSDKSLHVGLADMSSEQNSSFTGRAVHHYGIQPERARRLAYTPEDVESWADAVRDVLKVTLDVSVLRLRYTRGRSSELSKDDHRSLFAMASSAINTTLGTEVVMLFDNDSQLCEWIEEGIEDDPNGGCALCTAWAVADDVSGKHERASHAEWMEKHNRHPDGTPSALLERQRRGQESNVSSTLR